MTDNKAVLITGASAGIGRAVSIHLSKLGYRVMMVARNEEKLKEVYSLLEGEGHRYISFDLSNLDEIEKVIKSAAEEMGPFSGLVHSAGISFLRPLNLLKPKILNDIMQINFYSYVELVRCLSKQGNYQSPTSVIGISSIASVMGDKGKLGYCASKAAMDAATRCMAKELAPKGIRVNTIRPSWVKTDLLARYEKNWAGSQVADEIFAKHLMGFVEPEQVAELIAFLLSDSAKTITGSFLPIDSGALA